MVLRDLFHANILQEVYLKSKSFLWNKEKCHHCFAQNVPLNLLMNSKGGLKNEHGNAGYYFPTLSNEPKNPNS